MSGEGDNFEIIGADTAAPEALDDATMVDDVEVRSNGGVCVWGGGLS